MNDWIFTDSAGTVIARGEDFEAIHSTPIPEELVAPYRMMSPEAYSDEFGEVRS